MNSPAKLGRAVCIALTALYPTAGVCIGPENGAQLAEGHQKILISIGRRAFFDTQFSADGTVSCATCHEPAKAFSDGKPRAMGIHGRSGTRNTPSLLNVGSQQTLFWDGRVKTLEQQALMPFTNPFEHGLADKKNIENILREDSWYAEALSQAFQTGTQSLADQLSVALAVFQRQLVSFDSPFDRYQSGDKAALTASAERGYKLFTGAAGCSQCHSVSGTEALFSDHRFHLSPLRLSDAVSQRLPLLTTWVVEIHQAGNIEQLDRSITEDASAAALGRFTITLQPDDIGKFKTPSLRNVALTAPYMHDGSIPTLAQVIEIELYNHLEPERPPIDLPPREKADLEQFLMALTGQTATRDISSPRH